MLQANNRSQERTLPEQKDATQEHHRAKGEGMPQVNPVLQEFQESCLKAIKIPFHDHLLGFMTLQYSLRLA